MHDIPPGCFIFRQALPWQASRPLKVSHSPPGMLNNEVLYLTSAPAAPFQNLGVLIGVQTVSGRDYILGFRLVSNGRDVVNIFGSGGLVATGGASQVDASTCTIVAGDTSNTTVENLGSGVCFVTKKFTSTFTGSNQLVLEAINGASSYTGGRG